MVSFIGLRLKNALALAEANRIKTAVIGYSSKNGVKDSDSDIVIRERIKDGTVELVVSAFKTKV